MHQLIAIGINIKMDIKIVLPFFIVICCTTSQNDAQNMSDKPHIIFIVADDLVSLTLPLTNLIILDWY
jgi:hypothetical protein